jgi:hypothetical protein
MVKFTELHKKNLEKMAKKYGVDIKTIDIQALWDSKLSAKENYNNIKTFILSLSDNVNKKLEEKYDKDYVEYYNIKATEREEEYYKKEFEKRIEEIKNNNIVELSEYYKDYFRHIETFLENKICNGFLCVGERGIGKTFNLIIKLKEKGINFRILKGHISALSFYRYLYENREKQYIIIDDIAKLINDKDIISLLLGALDYNSKLVCWTSSSPLTSDLPREFVFNSKIFILANEFDNNNEFLRALKDRCVFYELKFTKEQIIEMLYIMAKKRNYNLEIVDFIKELTERHIIENLSLRLLDKIYPYYQMENWKKLVKQIIEIDELKDFVYQLIKSGKLVKEQVEEFKEKTGLSKTTYFYIKAKILGRKVEGYNYE